MKRPKNGWWWGFSRRSRIVIVFSLIAILVGWWAWSAYGPKPLGDRFEPIGRSYFGCWIICDAKPTAVYYYGTNLTIEQVEKAFRSANVHATREMGGSDGYTFQDVTYSGQAGRDFTLTYYTDGAAFAAKKHLALKSNQHIVELDGDNYNAAKASL